MKCLEKDRNRRYETPNSLARDVERYLHDEPVQACPPSTAYRFRKFAVATKRCWPRAERLPRRWSLALGSPLGSTFRATTESTAKSRLRLVAGNARAPPIPIGRRAPNTQSANMLDDFSAGLGNQLAGQPEVEADITVGDRQIRIGGWECTTAPSCTSRRPSTCGVNCMARGDERVADSLSRLRLESAPQGRHAEAETSTSATHSRFTRNTIPIAHRTVRALWSLQQFLMRRRGTSPTPRECRQRRPRFGGRRPGLRLRGTPQHPACSLAAKSTEGKYAEAEKLARRAVDIHRRVHGNQHPETAWGLFELCGQALAGQRKLHRRGTTTARSTGDLS